MSKCSRAPLPMSCRSPTSRGGVAVVLLLCFLTHLAGPLLLLLLFLVIVPVLKIAVKEFHHDTLPTSPSMSTLLPPPLHSSSFSPHVCPSSQFHCLYAKKAIFLCHRSCCIFGVVVFILCFFSALIVKFLPHEFVQQPPTTSSSSWALVTLVSASNNVCSCQDELSILSDFYDATNGASWKNSDGWNGACTEAWFGVDCQGQHVVAINLPNNGLSGTLPYSLTDLTGLTQLNLGINNISGTLPLGWQSFTTLVLLSLYMNNITGTLPPQWGNMRTIETLSLYNNQLSGPLPWNWGSMSSLATLYLHNNLLSGSLPENWPASMTSLGNLYLDNNSLRGTLPALWSSFPLAVLSVSNNCLYGPVPLSYINLPLQIDGFRVCGTRITNATRCVAPCTNSTTTPAPANTTANDNNTSSPSATPYDNNTPWPAFCDEDVESDSITLSMSSSAEHMSGAASVTASVSSTEMETHAMTSSFSGTNSAISMSEISACTSTPISASQMSTSLSKSPSASHNLHATRSTSYDNAISQTSVVAQSLSMPSQTRSTSYDNAISQTSVVAQSLSMPSQTRSTSYDNAISQTSVVTQSLSMPSQTRSKRGSTSFTTSRSMPTPSTWVCSGMIDPMNISVALMPPNSMPSGATTVSVVVLQQDADQPSVISLSTTAKSASPLLRGDMTSSPLRRNVLLAGLQPTIVTNISFSSVHSFSPLRWVISNVSTVSMNLPGGRSTLPAARSRWAVETSHDVMWSTIAVEAPEGGWVPSSTPLLVDTSFIVTFTFSCDAGAVFEMVVTVPAPGNVPSIAGKVESATRYSQIVSVLAGGASSGSALGRVMATRSMVLCDADSAVGGGLIDFHFVRICTEDDADSTRVVARSAVVSNILVLAVVTTSLCTCAVAWMFICQSTLIESAVIFCLPSSLLPVWAAILPSTSAASTLLWARSSDSPCKTTDVLLALSGTIISLCSATAVVIVWLEKVRRNDGALPETPSRWHCVAVTKDPKSTHENSVHGCDDAAAASSSMWNVVLHRLTNTARRRWRWATTPKNNSKVVQCIVKEDSQELQAMAVLLDEFRVLWYSALDHAILALIACLAVVSGLDRNNSDVCRSVTALTIVMLLLQLAVLVLSRPFSTVFSFVHSSLTLVLTCVSVLAQFLYMLLNPAPSPVWLVELSAGCNLAVVGVTAVKMLMDAWELCKAIRRRYRRVCASNASQRMQHTSHALVVTDVADVQLGLRHLSASTSSVFMNNLAVSDSSVQSAVGTSPPRRAHHVEFDEPSIHRKVTATAPLHDDITSGSPLGWNGVTRFWDDQGNAHAVTPAISPLFTPSEDDVRFSRRSSKGLVLPLTEANPTEVDTSDLSTVVAHYFIPPNGSSPTLSTQTQRLL